MLKKYNFHILTPLLFIVIMGIKRNGIKTQESMPVRSEKAKLNIKKNTALRIK